MSDYVKSTDFASKDTLPSGNSAKIVRGTELDAEFEALEVAVATKADLASPSFTGSPTAPTATAGDSSTKLASTAFVGTAVATAVLDAVNNVGYPAFKNRFINGAMMIDQRNAGASVTPITDPTYTLDRWAIGLSQASKLSVQQNAGSVTPPVGFTNYLGVTSLSAYSIGSSDYFALYQRIEGFNVADLAWGTANAKTITLSFQVYSSLTGTFGGSLVNGGGNRSYPFTYTVSSANTWTTVNITVAGDTSGTWLTTNGIGIRVTFGLGVGSTFSGTAGSWAGANYLSATGATSVVGTNGATFYITGVQLEKGSTATSFDYRPYGTELALCQRYYSKGGVKIASGSGSATSATIFFKSEMRAAPTMAYGNSPQGAGTSLPGGNDWVSTSEAAPYTSTSSLNCSYTASAEL